MAEPRFNNPYFWPPPPSMPGQVSPLVPCNYCDISTFLCHLFPCVNVFECRCTPSHRKFARLSVKLIKNTACRHSVSWARFLWGQEWHSHTLAVFCWAWPVNPFSWITWCSLTRSRSSWWPRRSDPCIYRLPPPPPSSLCWCPPRPQTVVLSTACRCQSPSHSRCRATTHSHKALDSQILLCTLAPPPALDQVNICTVRTEIHKSALGFSWIRYTLLKKNINFANSRPVLKHDEMRSLV